MNTCIKNWYKILVYIQKVDELNEILYNLYIL